MAGVSLTPRRSVAAEDIRDLQSGTDHAGRALGRRLGPVGGQQRETIERADDRADHVGGDLRVERRRVDLGMAEQDLNSGEHRYSARAGGWQNCAAACAASRAS